MKQVGDFNSFIITLTPTEFIRVHSENIINLLLVNEQFYDKIKGESADISANVSYKKQIDFLLEALNSRVKQTGETSFDFNIKEGMFRHILSTSENENELLTMPSPLSLGNGQRLTLPLLLEVNGIIDINSVKIVSAPAEINDIDVVFAISKPSIKNRYLSESYALTPEQRSRMNTTELKLYEDIYTQLQLEYCFGGRNDIETNFALLTSWMIRKMSYCLEEPSFVKDKALLWINQNSNKKYQQMEDEFFLPFLHEKLTESFGSLVTKKPEKFGGEIDILFGNLPVELKVNRGKSTNLIDDIVEEKYRPASQAATYAAITRLGFVVVLDLPEASASITNLNNCCKIITKGFPNNDVKTVIVVLIFYCNLPKPSAAI